jgi:hypothetical protein
MSRHCDSRCAPCLGHVTWQLSLPTSDASQPCDGCWAPRPGHATMQLSCPVSDGCCAPCLGHVTSQLGFPRSDESQHCDGCCDPCPGHVTSQLSFPVSDASEHRDGCCAPCLGHVTSRLSFPVSDASQHCAGGGVPGFNHVTWQLSGSASPILATSRDDWAFLPLPNRVLGRSHRMAAELFASAASRSTTVVAFPLRRRPWVVGFSASSSSRQPGGWGESYLDPGIRQQRRYVSEFAAFRHDDGWRSCLVRSLDS